MVENQNLNLWEKIKRLDRTPTAHNMKSILLSYAEEPRGFFIGRIVMSIGVWNFIGIWGAILSFVAFSVIWHTHAFASREWLGEFSTEPEKLAEIEHDFVFLSFMRGLINTGILIAIYYSENTTHIFGAELIFAGLLAVSVYQNMGSWKLMLSALAPQVITVLAIAVLNSLESNNLSHFFAPMYYVLAICALALGSLRDRVQIEDSMEESSKKAMDLARALAANKKDEELRQVVEKYAGIGFYRWNLGSNAIEWSRGAYKAFGCDGKDEPLGPKEFLESVNKADRPKMMEFFTNSKLRKDIREMEFRITTKNGEEKQILSYIMPILNEDFEITGIEGMVIDQTLSKTLIQKQEATKKLLDLALKNGKSFVLVRDSSTKEAECYGDFSIFGFNTDINPNKVEDEILQHVSDEDGQKIVDALSNVSDRNETVTFEHEIKRSPFDIAHARATIYVDGDIWNRKGRLVSITTDITDDVNQRTRLAEALQEANSSNRAKSEFLANMSHEIRTPLNGVIAVTGLLAKSDLNQSQKEMVEIIEASGSTLSHILNDVLDFARVESGMIEIEQIEFNLENTINVATALFRVKADEKGIGFGINTIGPVNSKFKGDPTRLRQIISNLLSNAIKFTENGNVNVEVEVVDDKNGDEVFGCFIRVRDSGCGISPDGLKRLFSRFQQADGSITRTHGGTGLGLAISKSLANLMGGDVTASSEQGIGSVFTLYLPLKHMGAAGAEIVTIASDVDIEDQGEVALSVLGVDDNPTNRRILEMVLRPMDINLELCENGQEAVDACKSRKFDVILMDLQMPVMDGLTATRKIRELEAIRGDFTPIVAVSANAMVHHIEEANAAGANLHLAKPFTPQQLVDCLGEALEITETKTLEAMAS